MEAKSAVPLKQMFNNAARADWDVLIYFKEDKRPKHCERFYGQKLILSSWSSIIKLKYVKNFLGDEFANHMMIEAKVYLPSTRGKVPELLTKNETKKGREQERKGKVFWNEVE
ncbi:hypothetical protein PIB30_072111 [Stylosanthes scabra]|uniref:Uncharacterized protein n=1 Tax=Stylosanthes scabra TaxID=79078 RepID=A0ABU6RPW2_9FABA|nr:hypothetical protein [Stylosanthes scabra]